MSDPGEPSAYLMELGDRAFLWLFLDLAFRLDPMRAGLAVGYRNLDAMLLNLRPH